MTTSRRSGAAVFHVERQHRQTQGMRQLDQEFVISEDLQLALRFVQASGTEYLPIDGLMNLQHKNRDAMLQVKIHSLQSINMKTIGVKPKFWLLPKGQQDTPNRNPLPYQVGGTSTGIAPINNSTERNSHLASDLRLQDTCSEAQNISRLFQVDY
jgi:hypothetical protein